MFAAIETRDGRSRTGGSPDPCVRRRGAGCVGRRRSRRNSRRVSCPPTPESLAENQRSSAGSADGADADQATHSRTLPQRRAGSDVFGAQAACQGLPRPTSGGPMPRRDYRRRRRRPFRDRPTDTPASSRIPRSTSGRGRNGLVRRGGSADKHRHQDNGDRRRWRRPEPISHGAPEQGPTARAGVCQY